MQKASMFPVLWWFTVCVGTRITDLRKCFQGFLSYFCCRSCFWYAVLLADHECFKHQLQGLLVPLFTLDLQTLWNQLNVTIDSPFKVIEESKSWANGSAIMSKLGNETAKYALHMAFDVRCFSHLPLILPRETLGRATWKLMYVSIYLLYCAGYFVNWYRHTMTLRFPEVGLKYQQSLCLCWMQL